MSRMKASKMKMLAMFLALTMLLAVSVPAYAAGSFSITITNPVTGYSYEAYQIFTGEYANGVLSNVDWGDGVNPAALLTELQLPASATSTGVDFTACTDAADVANAISNTTMNSANKEALAKIIKKHLTTTTSGTATAPNADGNYVIENLDGGYYMVVNSVAPEGAEKSRFMLQVIQNVTVTPKVDTPTVKKEIVDEEGKNGVPAKTVSIGDTVHFKVTSEVPNMTGYTKYFFIVNDTLSKGLTYSGDDSLAIKVGNHTLTGEEYSVSSSVDANGITKLKIVFKDFLNKYKNNVGDEIVVSYDATLNPQAETGINPNTNEVVLNYSTDPSVVPQGTDEPGQDDPPLGESPKAKSYVYTTSIEITKTDENGDLLSGAEFTLTGTAMNVVVVVEEDFVVDTLGEYYRLKDGTYTTEDPTGDPVHDAPYEDPDTLYSKTTKTTIRGKGQTGEKVDVKGTTVLGVLSFTGLGEGTYTLKESVTPVGYNTMDDIVFKVVASYNTAHEPTFTITDADGIEMTSFTVAGTGAISTTIRNLPGSSLPTTGGIGTTLFYVFGSLMVIGEFFVIVRC